MKTFAAAIVALGLVAKAAPALAQVPAAAAPADPNMMLTIFFKHDQTRTLDDLNAQLRKQGFYKAFPPEGTEVVDWKIVMGIGQVVTLRFPPSRLREINRIVENTAWGPYVTEFYPTYDYKAVGLANHEAALKGQ